MFLRDRSNRREDFSSVIFSNEEDSFVSRTILCDDPDALSREDRSLLSREQRPLFLGESALFFSVLHL